MFKIKNTTIKLPDPVTKILDPYLTRYFLLSEKLNIVNLFIHHFHSGDKEEWFHNHPFKWSISFILKNGYIEEIKQGDKIIKKIRLPFTFNFITQKTFHRVQLIEKDCWTLFLAGPRRETWEFWDPKTNEIFDRTKSPNSIA